MPKHTIILGKVKFVTTTPTKRFHDYTEGCRSKYATAIVSCLTSVCIQNVGKSMIEALKSFPNL